MQKIKAALGLTVLFLIAGTGPSSADDPARAARIAGAVYLGDVPTTIAEAQGFFEQQGVDAAVTYYSSGQQSVARLRAGEADFALTALTPVILDRLADATPGGPATRSFSRIWRIPTTWCRSSPLPIRASKGRPTSPASASPSTAVPTRNSCGGFTSSITASTARRWNWSTSLSPKCPTPWPAAA